MDRKGYEPTGTSRRRPLIVWIAVITAGLVLVGSGVGSATTAARPDSPGQVEPAAQPRYAKFYQQTVTWTPCGTDAIPLECTRVEVPVDWSQPDGQATSLALSRHLATGTRQGSLLLDPGGPGSSGQDFVPSAVTGMDKNLVAAYDFVGWDPRGSGESDPLTCPTEADTAFAVIDSSPDTLDERLAYENAATTWAEACQRSSGPLFAHVDAGSSARDMDVLRAVLGDPELTYAGFSYGTVLGTRYAEMFPDRVGRMVLDSAADPRLDYQHWMDGNASAKEDALNGYLATCEDRGECPFRSMTVPQARAWLLELIERTDANPLPVSEADTVTQSMLYDAIYHLLMQPRGWPDLDQVLTGLRDGNAEGALAASGKKDTDPPVSITNAAPLCLDLPDRRDAREVMADASRGELRNPVFARPTIAGVNTVCAQWPVPASARPHPVSAVGAPAILVVGITRDTAGPYAWSRSLAAQLSSGRLLTFDGYGHGAVVASECARSAESSYLVNGVLPAVGTVCRS